MEKLKFKGEQSRAIAKVLRWGIEGELKSILFLFSDVVGLSKAL